MVFWFRKPGGHSVSLIIGFVLVSCCRMILASAAFLFAILFLIVTQKVSSSSDGFWQFSGIPQIVQQSAPPDFPASTIKRPLAESVATHLGTAENLFRGLGWHEIPNTQLAPHCPSNPEIQGNTGCQSVIIAWNGGVADVKRDRLIVWGGGHSDYFGNEVYALDLRRLTMERLTDPSPVSNVNSCPEEYPDGRPSARHTYNGLVQVPEEDAMFSLGGSKSSCGSMSDKIWKLNLSTLKWTFMEPHHGDSFLYAPGISADYDPNTHNIFFSDTEHFFRYVPATNTVKRLSELHGVDYHQTGVIDPERKIFIMIGYPHQFWVIDIGPHSTYTIQDWSKQVRGCESLLNLPAPGLAFDAVQHVIVGWAGGDSVYLFDPDRKSCAEKLFPGGPSKAQPKGSYGRFRYFPALNVFALVNAWNQDAYALRLTEAAAVEPHSIVQANSRHDELLVSQDPITRPK
jgi:hypothetical protein